VLQLSTWTAHRRTAKPEKTMKTIYVFDNELLGDNGDDFKAALIDQHDGTEPECLAWFDEKYGPNDYTSSFSPND
jgi:hypothetical protein